MQQDPHKTDIVANTNYFPATGIPIPELDWKVEYLDGECECRIRETAGYHESERGAYHVETHDMR